MTSLKIQFQKYYSLGLFTIFCIKMTDKNKVLKQTQKTDEEPDFFEIYRQQLQKQAYMRFYYQEDTFIFKPLRIVDQKKAVQQQKQLVIKLPINRIISNTVTDTLIMNKFIYNNSKIVSSILQNGKQMININNIRRHLSWIQFLNREQLIMVKNAFYNLTIQDQWALEFSVLSISNLILKLSINISKLSCFLTSKKNTTNYLSLPTLCILFLQFLQYNMFLGKDLTDDLAKSQFLRQIPKITYIKFSQFFNKQQLMLMETGQYYFFTQHSPFPIRNVQYFQFYQEENKRQTEYQKMTKYDYIRWINLCQRYGIKSPLGFQILFLFRTIYFKLIKDFNPDVILFVEDYDNKKRSILPEIRALLISELMQQVTGKVFVMREVGFKRHQDTIFKQFGLGRRNQMKQNKMIEQSQMESQGMINQSKEDLSIPGIVAQRIKNIPLITKQIQQKLDLQQRKLIQKYFQQQQQKIKKMPNSLYPTHISKIQQILRDDLSYISLALIQRNNFESIYTQSHQYIYSEDFLRTVGYDLQQYWLKQYIQISNDNKTDLQKKINHSIIKLVKMIENSQLNEVVLYKDYYDSIFDLRLNQQIELKSLHPQTKQVVHLQYRDQDQLYVFYSDSYTLVFIFKLKQFIILRQNLKPQKNHKQQIYNFQMVIDWAPFPLNLISENSSYVITDKYIYKGFGLVKQNQQILGKNIFRTNYVDFLIEQKIKNQSNSHKINNKQAINSPNYSSKSLKYTFHFQQMSQCFLQKDKNFTQILLINKNYGWGIYDKYAKNVIFMGGYGHNCLSQHKINKLLHICNDNKKNIRALGKTSTDIFLGCKYPKAKIPLYPFIYGITFTIGKSCYIINTNGFIEGFTNSNKIFLTQFTMGTENQDPKTIKYGITQQRKLYVNYEDEQKRIQIVTLKQFLVYYIVNSYNLINSYQNRCILQTLDEGTIVLQLNPSDKINQKKTFSLKLTAFNEEVNGFKEKVLFFNPLQI